MSERAGKMDARERVDAIIHAYLDEIEQVKKDSGLSGLFGFGKAPKNDPANDRFLGGMKNEIGFIASEQLSSKELCEVLKTIYTAQDTRQDFVYYVLIAVHGETMPLIAGLAPEDAAILLKMYETRFPRNQRLPVQDLLIGELRRQAGVPGKQERGLFSWHKRDQERRNTKDGQS